MLHLGISPVVSEPGRSPGSMHVRSCTLILFGWLCIWFCMRLHIYSEPNLSCGRGKGGSFGGRAKGGRVCILPNRINQIFFKLQEYQLGLSKLCLFSPPLTLSPPSFQVEHNMLEAIDSIAICILCGKMHYQFTI